MIFLRINNRIVINKKDRFLDSLTARWLGFSCRPCQRLCENTISFFKYVDKKKGLDLVIMM